MNDNPGGPGGIQWGWGWILVGAAVGCWILAGAAVGFLLCLVLLRGGG